MCVCNLFLFKNFYILKLKKKGFKKYLINKY